MAKFGQSHMFVWVDAWPRLILLLQYSHMQFIYLLEQFLVLHRVITNGNVGL